MNTESSQLQESVETSLGHSFTSEASKTYACHICPEKFNEIRQIKSHWYGDHGFKHPSQCKICDIAFPTRQQANDHKLSMHGSVCEICNKSFKKIVGLEDHMRFAHQRAMKYSCKICGDVLTQQRKLIDHMKKHESSSERPILFRCTVCGKVFVEEKEVKDHEKIHDDKMHCEFCNRIFPRKIALQCHKRSDHPFEHAALKEKAAKEKLQIGKGKSKFY